jgi:hypothetical protein
LVLREKGQCIALWPVQVGADAGSLSNYFSALFEPIHAPGLSARQLQPLIRTLRVEGHKPGVLRFAPMDPESASFALLNQAFKLAGLLTYKYFRFGNWHLPCEGLSWDTFFASRPAILRNTVRRMRKRFANEGGSIELVSGGPRVEDAIEAYKRVYAESWKTAEPLQDFVTGLVRHSAQAGNLRFAIAWMNGKPVAAQIWLVAFGRAEIFKLAYDKTQKQYSPGTLLTAHLLEHVMDVDKVSEVDYLSGDDPYKATWMTERRERWGMVTFDLWTLGGAMGALRQAVSNLLHAQPTALTRHR